jgi:hypothetical protein
MISPGSRLGGDANGSALVVSLMLKRNYQYQG